MDPKAILITFLAAAPLTRQCDLAAAPAASSKAVELCFSSPNDGVESTLTRRVEAQHERLRGITELDTGARLSEDVTLDPSGALLRAELLLMPPDGAPVERVIIDRERGSVETSTAAVQVHWQVPRDFPWVWGSPLYSAAKSEPISTPLEARVVFRAASSGRMVRRLDLGALRSYSLAADQLFVADGAGGTVVLGNDTAEIENGMPTSTELKALDLKLFRSSSCRSPRALLALAPRPLTRSAFAQ